MQYVCNVGSQPGTPLPVSSCNNFVYFEMWNEFNTSGYWTGTVTQLAQMSLDAAAIIRTYCSGCYVVGGSVSAGGVGGGGSISGDYDVALLAYLTAWGGLSGFVKPDYVSIHPYPSRDNVFPAPFPTTLVSNSNSVCTSGNTPNSSCYVAVYQEISQVKGTAVLQNAAISAWAAGTPVIGSEGGFGVMRAVAGGNTSYAATSFSITSNVATVTGTNNFTSGETIILDGWTTATYFNEVTVTVLSTGLSSSQYEFNFTHANVSSTSDTGQANDLTNTTFLRAAYISQWMMTLWAQGTAVQLLYAGYDNTCTWGVYWECPNNSSPGWHTAFTQTQTWVNESTLTGTWTSTAVSGGNVWALSVDVGGNAAQITFFDGWLTSYTKSTSFSTVQNLAGTTSSTGGGVTLNQQPVLLTTNPTVNAPNPPLLVGAKVVIHTGGAS
jgi:hypothetical protein